MPGRHRKKGKKKKKVIEPVQVKDLIPVPAGPVESNQSVTKEASEQQINERVKTTPPPAVAPVVVDDPQQPLNFFTPDAPGLLEFDICSEDISLFGGQEPVQESEYDDCLARNLPRTLFGFWLIGISCNFMHAIALLSKPEYFSEVKRVNYQTGRDCFMFDLKYFMALGIAPCITLGAILLFPLCPMTRMVIALILNVAGSFAMAFAILNASTLPYYLGTCCCSLGSALAEQTALAMTTKFHYTSLTALSSGIGYGNLMALFVYIFMRREGYKVDHIISISTCFMGILGLGIGAVAQVPCLKFHRPLQHNTTPSRPLITPLMKFIALPALLPNALPYFVNAFAVQMSWYASISLVIYGMWSISPSAQRYWILMSFLIGNFVGKSIDRPSMTILRLIVYSILQVCNMTVVYMELYLHMIGQLWVMCVLMAWVGIVDGIVYLGSHTVITRHRRTGTRQFSLLTVFFFETLARIFALFVLFLVGNQICAHPLRKDLRVTLWTYYNGTLGKGNNTYPKD